VSQPAEAVPARLAITLGPPCPTADTRVRLGDGDGAVDFAVPGDADAVAAALVRALKGSGG
jgi:hypothetical protein